MKIFVAVLALCAVAYGSVPRLDGRIVGGKEVNIRDFPYQVSVRYNDQHICGGTILEANVILTAAHCVYGKNHTLYSVRVGNSSHANGISHIVSEVRENSNYGTPYSYDNDMAILKLSSRISFSSNALPIELQPEGVEVPAGTKSWISGWGVEYEGSSYDPPILRATDVAVVNNADCDRMYGGGKISSHMMCAQSLYHDSCQGDSGGPLVANGKLIGVVSWGIGCGKPEYPGVYAKVSDMYSWIASNAY